MRLVEISTFFARYNSDGTLEKTDETAFKTSYYKIDFSYWSNTNIENPFYLSIIEEDMINERKGRHFEYSDSAKEYLEPEERVHSGKLGAQVMTYAPIAISVQRDMDDKIFPIIEYAVEL